ncbi:MAG TPA: glycosylase [Spirochaetota bacterium]|nr:glycosylase [Spirochaetota bacterium]
MSRYRKVFFQIIVFIIFVGCQIGVTPDNTEKIDESKKKKYVLEKDMDYIYEKIKTPYKYGLVLISEKADNKVDSPTIFFYENQWYMTYIIYDSKVGYETWLAKSEDLIKWTTIGKIMSYTKYTWDSVQKAGYFSLVDYKWGGSYSPLKYDNKYWLSYLGGNTIGYEAGTLRIGIAFNNEPNSINGWTYLNSHVLSPSDHDTRWFENITIYKSTIIYDDLKLTGYPFVMYYNAKGDKVNPSDSSPERIGMAVSNDMINWKRYLDDPVIDNNVGISGDAYFAKIDDIFVMFYFGAFWGNIFPLTFIHLHVLMI